MPTTTPFCSAVNYIRTTLAAVHNDGAATFVLATGAGTLINDELTNQGRPSLSATKPLRFTVVNPNYFNPLTQQILDSSKASIFTATGLSTDTLTGSVAVEGSANQAFDAGSIVLVEITAGQINAIQDAVNDIESGATGTNATALQGVDLSATAPTSNQILTYNSVSAEWEPSSTATLTSVTAITGMTTGTLRATGAVTADSTVAVTGAVTAGSTLAVTGAITGASTAAITGNLTAPIIDNGGQVYNVTASRWGLKGDGAVFTVVSGTATNSTVTVTGFIPGDTPDAGKKITIVGAGTSGAGLKTTIASSTAVTFTATGLTSGSAVISVTGVPTGIATGQVIAIPLASSTVPVLYSTVLSWTTSAPFTVTLADNVTQTGITSATCYLNPTITLSTPIVTTVTNAVASAGTDNYPLMVAAQLTLQPWGPGLVPGPTWRFPAGRFMFDIDGLTGANLTGWTLEGSGKATILGTFDCPTVGGSIFKGRAQVTVNNLTFASGQNPNYTTITHRAFTSIAPTGLGNGGTFLFNNVTSSGQFNAVILLQRDDSLEATDCNLSSYACISHTGGNTAGQSLGSVKMFGGSIHDFGVTGSNEYHGLYLYLGVACELYGVTFYNQSGTVIASNSFTTPVHRTSFYSTDACSKTRLRPRSSPAPRARLASINARFRA
jgi:hypothetical protein